MNLIEEVQQFAQYNAGAYKLSRPRSHRQNHEQKAKHEHLIIWAVDFKKALDKLTTEERATVLLCDGAGFSQHQAEQMTGISQRTISNCRMRGLDKLAKARRQQRNAKAEAERKRQYCAAAKPIHIMELKAVAQDNRPQSGAPEASQPKTNQTETPQRYGPACHQCANGMIPSGSCYRCPNCGETSGCS